MKLTTLTAMLAMAGMLAAPAMAQQMSQARIAEVSCVYDGLAMLSDDEFFAIADIQIEQVTEGEEFEALTAIVGDISEVCVDEYDWDETQMRYATEMALQGVVSDTMATDLVGFGMTEAQLNKVDELVDALSDEDVERLFTGEWREAGGRAVYDRVWLANGLPTHEGILERLPVYLEASVVAATYLSRWISEYPE